MRPPFPGMDPYMEAAHHWPDVHASLIATIREQLQPALVPRYVAVITPYVTFESIEIAPARVTIPDLAIYERQSYETTTTAVAIAPAPLTGRVPMDIPTRYGRIEIRTTLDQILVTAIEVLSPANKRPGLDGADAYERKRQEIFRSDVHLIEIDLLRAGRRPQVITPLPPDPYFIFVSRAYRRPEIEIWPLSLQTAIPLVPVPLQRPDPDVALDLGLAIQHIYTSARYDLLLDYSQQPAPPAFSSSEQAWIEAQLVNAGLRSY